MKTIGFLRSKKKNEKRIALLPSDLKHIKNIDKIFIENNYGEEFGISDLEYLKLGANVCTFEEILEKDIICDPKIGDNPELKNIKNKTIFGWIHAVQNFEITQTLIDNSLTVFAWEDMFYKEKHIFWKNNQIAGKAAVISAFLEYGELPLGRKVAVLGNGNIANGAKEILFKLGAEVTSYNRKQENLFKKELKDYDVVVNAILWNPLRKDHIIYEEDLLKMKKNSMIIDISCDKAGAIETSYPTKINNPVYKKNGVLHYVVDHTPSLLYKEASASISNEISFFLDDLIQGTENEVLEKSLILKEGKILDKRIVDFQNRKNL